MFLESTKLGILQLLVIVVAGEIGMTIDGSNEA